jgi:hypothetical protein
VPLHRSVGRPIQAADSPPTGTQEWSSTAYEREKGCVPLKIISQSADELVLKEGGASGARGRRIRRDPFQFFHHRGCQQREGPGLLSEEAIDRNAGLDVQHRRHLSHRDPKTKARAKRAGPCESGRSHAAASACSPGDCFQRRAGTGARSPANFFQHLGRLGGSDGRPDGGNRHRGFKWRSLWKCASRKSRRPTWAWESILSAELPVV